MTANVAAEEKKKLKEEIINGLDKIEGIEAHDCDQFFAGRYRAQLGDIIVTSTKYEMDSTIGEKEFLMIPRNMHSLDGIFMAYGQGIKKNYKVMGANIYDVTPTMLHFLGILVPAEMDGKVLDIFTADSAVGKRKVQVTKKNNGGKEKLKAAIMRVKG